LYAGGPPALRLASAAACAACRRGPGLPPAGWQQQRGLPPVLSRQRGRPARCRSPDPRGWTESSPAAVGISASMRQGGGPFVSVGRGGCGRVMHPCMLVLHPFAHNKQCSLVRSQSQAKTRDCSHNAGHGGSCSQLQAQPTSPSPPGLKGQPQSPAGARCRSRGGCSTARMRGRSRRCRGCPPVGCPAQRRHPGPRGTCKHVQLELTVVKHENRVGRKGCILAPEWVLSTMINSVVPTAGGWTLLQEDCMSW
jgi:hypothetical protein